VSQQFLNLESFGEEGFQYRPWKGAFFSPDGDGYYRWLML
jgi:hypothetical protein